MVSIDHIESLPRVRGQQWRNAERSEVALDGKKERSSTADVSAGEHNLSKKAQKREALRDAKKLKKDAKRRGTVITEIEAPPSKKQRTTGSDDSNDSSSILKKTTSTREKGKGKKGGEKEKKEKKIKTDADKMVDEIIGKGPHQTGKTSQTSSFTKSNPNMPLALHYLTEIAEKVSSDPEKQLSNLYPFFLTLHDSVDNQQLKHCALISAVAVLRDILPGYRIISNNKTENDGFGGNGITGKGKGKMFSKAVFLSQKFEKLLLQEYEILVNRLTAKLRSDPMIYVSPLCSLITNSKAMHFNHRGRLLTSLVRMACYGGHTYENLIVDEETGECREGDGEFITTNNSDANDSSSSSSSSGSSNSSNKKVQDKKVQESFRSIVYPCCNAIKEIFATDNTLEVCDEIVNQIAQLAKKSVVRKGNTYIKAKMEDMDEDMIKTGSSTQQQPKEQPKTVFQMNIHLLDTLLDLKLDRSNDIRVTETEELDETIEGDSEMHREMNREFRESSIHGKKARELKSFEMKILTEVIVIYLRLLRSKKLHANSLLISALRGLGQFSILVNLELLIEILAELKDVLEDSLRDLNAENTMWVLWCAFRLLSSPGGKLLECDMSWLAQGFVDALPFFLLNGNSENPDLLYICIQQAQDCPQVYTKVALAPIALLVENLFSIAPHIGTQQMTGLTQQRIRNNNNGSSSQLNVIRNSEKILKRYYRLSTLLDKDGGLFGLDSNTSGSLVDRPISVYYQLLGLSHSYDKSVRDIATNLLNTKHLSGENYFTKKGISIREISIKESSIIDSMKYEKPAVLKHKISFRWKKKK